jgi:hypothetical protein
MSASEQIVFRGKLNIHRRLTAIEGVAQKLVSTRLGLGKCTVGHWEAWLFDDLLLFVGVDGIFMYDGRDTGSKAPPS